MDNPLLLNKRKYAIDSKALELSLRRRLSASELDVHYGRKARLVQDDDDRWAKDERFHAMEGRTPPPWHRYILPPANSAYPRWYEGIPPESQQRPAPLEPHEDAELLPDWELSHDQRGYVEFEIADQERRLARMGLVARNSQRGVTTPQTPFSTPAPKPTNQHLARTWAPEEKPAQTTLSPPIPKPTNHHCAPKETFAPQMWVPPKAQEQQSKSPACRGWVQQVPSLNSRARQETEQRKLAEQKLPAKRSAEQKREQQEIRLPAAKPGSLYPGPTRMTGILPPSHILHEDYKKQSRMSERALSALHKTKLASLEVIRQLKEEKERKDVEQQQQQQQQPKATSSAPRPETTRKESVKQLLAGVNRALEQKVEVAQGGAARTERVANGAFQAHSHKGREDALKCGRSFWEKYDKSYPIPRQSQDRPTSSEFARHTGTSREEVPHDSSRTSDLRAAVEAIDKTSGNLLGKPKTVSDQDKTPCLEPSGVVVSRNKENGVLGIADFSVVTFKDHPVIMVPRQDAPQPPIPWAEQMDVDTKPEEDNGGVKDTAENAPLVDMDIQSEWEEVEHSLQGDGWSEIEQDSVDIDRTGDSSSMDLEWASDVVSEGCV